jgi:hypothetical protein
MGIYVYNLLWMGNGLGIQFFYWVMSQTRAIKKLGLGMRKCSVYPNFLPLQDNHKAFHQGTRKCSVYPNFLPLQNNHKAFRNIVLENTPVLKPQFAKYSDYSTTLQYHNTLFSKLVFILLRKSVSTINAIIYN